MLRARRSTWLLLLVLSLGALAMARAQVFTVGERTATQDIKTDFKRTHVELSEQGLTERGRRDLVRNLDAEQGFAHRVMPLASTVTLVANGQVTPGPDGYKLMIYKKGQAAAPGDRVAITALEFKGDRILIDFNGGPYAPHRFLRHLQVGVGGVATADPNLTESATGWRIALVFEGGIPELSAPEVKALLEPLVDFGVKSGELAYAETLPAPIKSAINSHEVLVGMNHRMVLAALGQPESKVRETATEGKYEEWIYGHQPQTVRFVRFMGDRVTLIKVAALGKPIQVRDHDEMAGYGEPAPVRGIVVANGPGTPSPDGDPRQAPSLKLPNEAATPAETQSGTSERKVEYPPEHPLPGTTPASTPPPQQWTSPASR